MVSLLSFAQRHYQCKHAGGYSSAPSGVWLRYIRLPNFALRPPQAQKKTKMYSRRNLDIPTAKPYISNPLHESLRAAKKTGAPCVTAKLIPTIKWFAEANPLNIGIYALKRYALE